MFVKDHSSLQNVIHRVEQKRSRRQSENVFKTAAKEHVLINNALPTIMRKENSPHRLLNAKAPPLGEKRSGSLSVVNG